jgi:hypothetical protein
MESARAGVWRSGRPARRWVERRRAPRARVWPLRVRARASGRRQRVSVREDFVTLDPKELQRGLHVDAYVSPLYATDG